MNKDPVNSSVLDAAFKVQAHYYQVMLNTNQGGVQGAARDGDGKDQRVFGDAKVFSNDGAAQVMSDRSCT